MTLPSPTLTPEFSITDLTASLAFYVDILGFDVKFQRSEEGFAYLVREGGVALMLDEIYKGRTWKTGSFDLPLGRGVNIQIFVSDAVGLLARVKAAGIVPFLDMEERWYRQDEHEVGNRQFLVQDPDGYLLRFAEDMGSRPLSA